MLPNTKLLSRALFSAAAAGVVSIGVARADMNPEWVASLPVGSSLSAGMAHFVVDSAGVSYATGTTGSSGETDVVTAAFSPSGTLLWQHVFEGPLKSYDQGRGIALGPNGDLYVCGNTAGPDFFANVLLLQYDRATGALLKTVIHSSGPMNSEHGGSVVVDGAGGVYVAGATHGDGGDAMLLKFDASGALAWKRTWDGAADAPFSQDNALQVQLDPNGDVVTLIHGVMASLHPDFVVLKCAPGDGATIWTATWGVSGEDSPVDMAIDAAGDVYVTGTGIDLIEKYSTVKFDGSTGQMAWQRYDSVAVENHARAIALDGAGGVYVTGSVDPDGDFSNLNHNFFTVKRDGASGALQWTHLYGANCLFCYDVATDVAVDAAGNAYVVGSTSSPPYSSDTIAFRLNAQSGLEVERGIVPSAPSHVAGPTQLRFDAKHDLFIGGTDTDANTGALAASLIKYPTNALALYQLDVTPLIGGTIAGFAVENATPLGMQFLLFGASGTASIPAPPYGVVGIANPILLFGAPADATGTLAFTTPVPASIAGVTVWLQALQFQGATPVVKRTIE